MILLKRLVLGMLAGMMAMSLWACEHQPTGPADQPATAPRETAPPQDTGAPPPGQQPGTGTGTGTGTGGGMGGQTGGGN